MKLESLSLENFGAFVGTHSVPLSVEKGKPIVLLGALNGSGKTTFLDAIKLSLYGKMADCSTRGRLAYDKFLASCINRSLEGPARANVSLAFEVTNSDGRVAIKVSRSWERAKSGDISETLDVFRDGRLDPTLSKNWYEHVDEFMPLAIANLFLFDGEKIEYFADPKNSAELIRTGIDALLGIGLLSQLRDDLRAVVTKRLQKAEGNEATNARSEKILQMTLENADAAKALRLLNEQIEDLEVQIKRDSEELDRVAHEYKRHGGDLFDNRELLKQEKNETEKTLAALNVRIHSLVSGVLPMAAVIPQLEAMKTAAEQSQEYADASQRAEISATALQDFQRFVAKSQTQIDLQRLSELCVEFADTNVAPIRPKILLHADPSRVQDVRDRVQHAIVELQACTVQYEELQAESARLEASIAAVPDQADLERTAKALHEVEAKLTLAKARLSDTRAESDKQQKDLDESRARLDQLLKEDQNLHFANKTDERVVKQSERVRDTLTAFQTAMARKSVERLNVLIRESLQSLLRKKGMVSRVRVDPETFELTLFDDRGRVINVSRMSAGERQLVAVSIVWALTRASGRVLPTIIDTPLGRLDNKHRDLLIDGYFPFAGRQVLLLSTDSEIYGDRYSRLQEYCSKEFAIQFNEENGSSEFTSEYPFQEKEAVA